MEEAGYKAGIPETGAPPGAPGGDAVAASVERPDLSSLGPYVMGQWQQAKFHRRQSGVEDRLLACLRDVRGEYSDADKTKIQELEQPLVFVPNPDAKRRACNAIIRQIFFESYDPFYVLKPSPVPDLSPDDAMEIANRVLEEYVAVRIGEFVEQGMQIADAQEEALNTPPDPAALEEYVASRRDEIDNLRREAARKKVDRMGRKIADQRLDGNYNRAFMACVDYCSTYGTGVLKGPMRRIRERVKFGPNGPELQKVEVMEWTATNPFFSYPAKGSRDIQKGDYFERVQIFPRELSEMADLGAENGYFPDAINRVLTLFPAGGYTFTEPTDVERNYLEKDGTVGSLQTSFNEGIEAWCSVRGSILQSVNVLGDSEGAPIRPERYYDVNCIVVANEVVYCSVTNPRLGRPLYKGVFFQDANSWWGSCAIDKMRDLTRAYNASFRAKCVNVACSSGPMMFINTAKALPGQKYKVQPYKTVLWSDPTGMNQPPVRLFQPAANIDEITRDLETIEKQIDHVTGIPSTSHMDDTAASAGRTYNGMLLLIQAQKQGANDVILSMWEDVGRPALVYQYRYNMLFDPDPEIKGDCEVDAGGLLAILTKEQNRTALESFLNLVIASPAIQAVIGEQGMLATLRLYIQSLDGINPDNIVPSPEEMERRKRIAAINAQMQAIAQQPGVPGAPSAAPAPQTAPTAPAPRPALPAPKNQPVEM